MDFLRLYHPDSSTKNADSSENVDARGPRAMMPFSMVDTKDEMKCKSSLFSFSETWQKRLLPSPASLYSQSNLKAPEFLNTFLLSFKVKFFVWQQQSLRFATIPRLSLPLSLTLSLSPPSSLNISHIVRRIFLLLSVDTQKLFAEKIFILAQNDAF